MHCIFLFIYLLCNYFIRKYKVLLKKLTSKIQGPVVQSIVNLTTLLRSQLVKICGLHYQICYYFLLEKCENLLQLQCKRFSDFFNKKLQCFCDIYFHNFNKTLTNDVVYFEQRA